jgi:hypothetical protein
MKISLTSLLFAAAFCTALPVAAQTLKPGLWEITNQMQSDSSDLSVAMTMMKEKLASMSPEQRKMVTDMMSKNGMALNLDSSTPGINIKHCMTREMAARGDLPMQDQGGNCKYNKSALSGGSTKYSFTCSSPAASGDGTMTFSGSDAYTNDMNVTTTARGNPEQIKMKTTGKWVSADCGTVGK